jgi:hypothetical protein
MKYYFKHLWRDLHVKIRIGKNPNPACFCFYYKSSSIVERHIAGVVNMIASASLSPNSCTQYSWKQLSPMKSQTVPYLHVVVYIKQSIMICFMLGVISLLDEMQYLSIEQIYISNIH